MPAFVSGALVLVLAAPATAAPAAPVVPRVGPSPLGADLAGGSQIALTLTGTTDLTTSICGAGVAFTVPRGTDVQYCYLAHNTGQVTLSLHDLEDTQGPIFSGYPLALQPGFAMWLMQTRQPMAAGAFVAEWTSYNPGPSDVASDTDATPIVLAPPILFCNGPTSTFSNGLPTGWTSYDWLAQAALPDSDVDWSNLAGCGEAGNYTGGRGDAACASSDFATAQAYDTQLRSHSFSLAGVTDARIEFLLNYQDFDDGKGDAFEVDISLDGGVTWENLALNDTNDYGAFRAAPGVAVSIDLGFFAGEPDVRLGWRYVHDSGTASDWYAQVDNVRLLCDGGLFVDGFESGDTDAWSAALEEAV
jgi:hypothetical protein